MFLRTLTSSMLPLCLLFQLSNLHVTNAKQVNVTVDDQKADPVSGQTVVYQPPAAWQGGQNCSSCTAQPPNGKSKAYDGTWMDASFFPSGSNDQFAGQIVSATFPFIGSAVYVQTILTRSNSSPDGNSDFTFLIDDTKIGTFEQEPNNDTTYLFNQTIFAHTGMDNKLHTLRIEVGNKGQKALVMLDAIIYTQDNGTSSSTSVPDTNSESSSTNIGVIVGPVIGGLAVLAAAIIFFLVMRKRRRNRGVRVNLDSPTAEMVDLGERADGSSAERSASRAGALNVTPFIMNDRRSRDRDADGASTRRPPSSGPSSNYGSSSSSGAPESGRYEPFSKAYEAHWAETDGDGGGGYTTERERDAGSLMRADSTVRHGPLPPAYTDILPEHRERAEEQDGSQNASSEEAAPTNRLIPPRKS